MGAKRRAGEKGVSSEDRRITESAKRWGKTTNVEDFEGKWSRRWIRDKVFEVEPSPKKKFFITTPYPYVNARLHIGHAFTLTRSDVIARYKRLRGYNVLQPQGFHLTGEPIVGAAKKISKGDTKQKRILIMSGVPAKDIAKFAEPEHYAMYFIAQGKKDLRDYGLAIDWGRFFYTTELNKAYNRFIEWQFSTLKKMGLVVKGTHPLVWCPNCRSPTGDHDRRIGEGVGIEEYVAYKFKLVEGKHKGTYLPTATLRPETVFGVTNIWLKPKEVYKKIEMGGERFVVSPAAIKKLEDQDYELKVVEDIKSEELIGQRCENPVTKDKVEVMPANFVDMGSATGVVMSVPAHAPYDYIALKELGKEACIVILDSDDYPHERKGGCPAKEVCVELGVKGQNDVKKLEMATKRLYKHEFHTGVLNKKCGNYAGMKVAEGKDTLKKEFLKKGFAIRLYEVAGYVECRCGGACHVKILKDQWFLKYSDPEWKEKTLKYAKSMKFYPEEARNILVRKLEEYEDKACARRSGLGTPLPWAKSWIIESLSDSTIYMAFYILAKYLNRGELSYKELNDDFFDYVFRGVERKKPTGKMKKIRKDFEYWYPVDLRNSGKDLLNNHLIFYLYHHTALFDRSMWPRGISINGFALLNGEKMSKSAGNFITLREAVDRFGCTATRLACLDTADGLENADFRTEYAKDMKRKVESIIEFVKSSMEENRVGERKSIGKVKCKGKREDKKTLMNRWIESRIQKAIQNTEAHMSKYETRSAAQYAFHGIFRDLSKYKAQNEPENVFFNDCIEKMALIMAPFVPHLAEEIWSILGHKSSIFEAEWPKLIPEKIDEEAERAIWLRNTLSKDVAHIAKLTRKKFSKIKVIIASGWKYRLYNLVMKTRKKNEGADVKALIKEVMKHTEMKKHGKEAIEIVNDALKERDSFLDRELEMKALKESKEFFRNAYRAEFIIEEEEGSKEEKAKRARPGKPAIVLG